MSDVKDGDAARIVERAVAGASLDNLVLPVGYRMNEYVIESELAHGGFGIVYLAHDEQLYRQVAIKEFMPSTLASRRNGFSVDVKSQRQRATFAAGLRSFVNEARLLARFDHPALVKVYRFWEQNDTAYMVMPYYRGQTLSKWLRGHSAPVPEATLLRIVGALLEPLELLHAENVFHRDIAPDNILILEHEQPVLLDLGAARQIIGDMTQALTVFLKPGYAPVEQYAEGSFRQGPWTDIYALAAVMYFAVLGKAPAPSIERMVSDDRGPLQRLAEGKYSPRFLSAIDRALAPLPADRPASVAEFRRLLGIGQADAPGAASESPDDDVTVGRAGQQLGPLPTLQPIVFPTAAPVHEHQDAKAAHQGKQASTPAAAATRKKSSLEIGAIAILLMGAAALVSWLVHPSPVESPVARIPAAPLAGAAAPASTAPLMRRAPAATVPALAPPPAGDASAAKVLQQIFERRSALITVEATATKKRLMVGRDALQLTVLSDKRGYLTVLMARPAGPLLQIFPDQKQREFLMDPTFPARLPNIVAKGPPGIEQILCIVSARPLGLATEPVAGESYTRLNLHRPAMVPEAAPSSRCAGGAIGCDAAFGAALVEITQIE